MKLRKSRKLVSILVTLSMLMVLLVPLATPALASTNYSGVTTKTFDPDEKAAENQDLGTFMIDIDPLTLGESTALLEAVDSNGDRLDINDVIVSDPYDDFSASIADVTYSRQSDESFKITITAKKTGEFQWLMALNVDASDAAEGEITYKITKLTGQLESGTVTVGKATGGDVKAEVLTVNTINEDGGDVTIRLTESVAGALDKSAKSVKLTLPSGFEWDWNNAIADTVSGNAEIGAFGHGNNDRDLFVNVTKESTTKTVLDIKATIDVDDSKAKYGDVNMTLGGDSDMTVTSLIIAVFGDYSATVSAEDVKTVVAGQLEQDIGRIVVEEDSPGSLSKGKTITLTLPANARWYEYPNVDDSNITVESSPTASGTNGRVLKYKVTKESTSKSGTVKFKDAKVHLAVDQTGDLDIEVGGSAGAKGKVTVATIEPVVTVTADVKSVQAGKQYQAAGDIEISEGAAEAIADDRDLVIELPNGVEFQDTPTVEVVEGDLDIDDSDIDVDDNVLTIPIDGTSTTASKIKISGIEYRVSGTVAAGDIQVKIGGGALNEVNDEDALEDLYPNFSGSSYNPFDKDGLDGDYSFDDDGIFPTQKWAAKVVNAKVVTDTTISETVFTIGAASYTVDGVEQTMDVAPYIKSDRTYLPFRYAAYAAGVTDSNIMWNQADQSVIMVKGDRVIKMVIGDTTMYVNGVAFTMDVAPELVDPGRTMLPVRYVAQALGCEVIWDEATQTVTIK